MNRLNRRRFLALGATSSASVVLVACGNEAPSEVDLNPTQIPDVAGAPPTLAPITEAPETDAGAQAEDQPEDQPANGENGDTGGAQAEAVTIIALDSLAFDPAEIDVSPGQTLTLQNDGFLQHDLAVDDWGGPLTPMLNNGETAEFTIPDDAAVGDEFEFYCSVPGHREGGMVGTFTIVEAGAAAPAEDGAAEEEEPAAATTDDAAEPAGDVTIIALDSLAFEPAEVEVSPGQTLTLQNDGFLQHDLAVDDWGGPLTPMLNNGETAEFTIPDDAEVGSEYEFYCSVPGHREGGMVGTFTIVEAGAAAAEGEEAPAEDEAADEADAPAAATTDEGAEQAGGEAITIVGLDTLAFEPAEVEVSPGQTVILQNDGFLQHDLAVDDWGGPLTPMLNNGETAEFTIPDDAEVGAEYEFYCSVPGHREGGMVGTFSIAEGGDAAAAAPAEEEDEGEATPAATPEDGAAEGDASDPMAVQVVATEWEFSPTDFEVAPGGTITLMNEGTVAHGMSADAFDGTFIGPVGAGQSAEFTVPDDLQPGDTIEYSATNESASGLGMGGTITIVEGDGAGATPAATPVATPADADDEPDAAGAGGEESVDVTAVDIAFEETELSIPADTDVTITLHNDGVLQHDFVIEDTDFATPIINGGETAEVVVNLPAGEYTYYCSVPGHRPAGMEGTLTVG